MTPPEGTRAFSTSLGEIWLVGAAAAFESDKPIVLAISGAFAETFAFDQLAERLPDAAVLIGHLPGNHCPPLVVASIGAYAAAYSQAIDQLGRPTLVCGSSVGALVALAMRNRSIYAVVAIEPPLRTANLWPLIPRLQAQLSAGVDPPAADFIRSVFGVSETGIEDRDYAAVLDGLVVPTWCLLGETPLEPERPVARDPSFVDERERQRLRKHPAVRTQEAPGVGHNVQGEAGHLVLAAIRDLMSRAPGLEGYVTSPPPRRPPSPPSRPSSRTPRAPAPSRPSRDRRSPR